MRQRRLLELMADYNIDLQYHPNKINVVSDNLSTKPMMIFLMQQKCLRRLDI